MAFSTEFIMGAGGGGVEETPVSMSGNGTSTLYPLATVDAGDGAFIIVRGKMVPGSTNTSNEPYLHIGSAIYRSPRETLTSQDSAGIGGYFTGTVEVAILSRSNFGVTSFDGTVYVTRI